MSRQNILPSKHWCSLKRDTAEQKRKENLDFFMNLQCIKESKSNFKSHQLHVVEHLFRNRSLCNS